MSTSTAIVICREDGGGREVILEDDGRVAFAYLREGDAIVADVWLYNVGDSPAAVDWRAPAGMPFQNPAAFCGDETVPRLHERVTASCAWSPRGVVVSLDSVVVAALESGVKPGWSRNARVAGPLARPLAEHGGGGADVDGRHVAG